MIYVDSLLDHGWILRGHTTRSCHMFTDAVDLTELHQLAERIGMKRAWFQDDERAPHYDLTPYRRQCAIAAGAHLVSLRAATRIWQARRLAVAALELGAV